jgi:uncharacterized integral membrane protein
MLLLSQKKERKHEKKILSWGVLLELCALTFIVHYMAVEEIKFSFGRRHGFPLIPVT